jgi:SPX domain protein involved in polyphosphate accumulation
MGEKVSSLKADIEEFSVISNYRYERKFSTGNLSNQQVIQTIKLHPSFFKEIYYKRQVNNIYFDTPDFEFLRHNQIGIADRKKVRIRWYGEDVVQVTDPVLEIKTKRSLVGDKWSYPLAPFDLKDILDRKLVSKIVGETKVPSLIKELLSLLNPSLFNSYKRQYFQTADKQFRLTVDNDLTYRRVVTQNSIYTMIPNKELNNIVELKYGLNQDDKAAEITSLFPFRLDKSSKYVNGMEMSYLF